jgi:hypothetical protein
MWTLFALGIVAVAVLAVGVVLFSIMRSCKTPPSSDGLIPRASPPRPCEDTPPGSQPGGFALASEVQ